MFLGRKVHNFLIFFFARDLNIRNRALYYESTAGAFRWRPDCRMEPRLTPGEDCLEIHLLLVPSHNTWPHRDTRTRPNHLWFCSSRTTSFLALVRQYPDFDLVSCWGCRVCCGDGIIRRTGAVLFLSGRNALCKVPR